MHTDENVIANDKEETVDEASIVYEKAHGTTTSSERDCTVRTTGLDPDSIGDSGTFLVVGTVAPTLLSTSICQMKGCVCLEEFWLNHKDSGREKTWTTFLSHPEHASKSINSNRSAEEVVMQCTNQVFPNLPDLDIGALIGGFRPNQKELSYKTNCYGILIHYRRTKNWIHRISGSELRVIGFSNRWTCFGLNPATMPKIVLHSPNQKLSRPKINWRISLGLSWI